MKITKKSVDSLQSEGSKPTFLWDENLAGFGVKALPSGTKKYLVKYRAGAGGRAAQQRWLTLGAHGQLTCEQARGMAQQALAAVARGEDPQLDKLNRRNAPTMRDVWEKFETDYLPRRKQNTRKEYVAQWRDVIEPLLGKLPVLDVSRLDVARLHKSLGSAPYRANRVLALCSRLLSLAESWEWRVQGSNPCRYVEKYKEQPRNRYLILDELRSLGRALDDLVASGGIQVSAANAMRMLLLTGARLNEILTAKWDWVSWEAKTISLPDSKTGEKIVYLSESALGVLRSQLAGLQLDQAIPSTANASPDYIFPGRNTGKPMVNLRKPWMRVCDYAGLEGVRLHDLRHTAASIAAGQGTSLPVIGRLLGHSQAQTTLRYAHIDTDPALVAINQIGEAVEKAMTNSNK